MLNHKDKRLWTVHEKQDLINRETYKKNWECCDPFPNSTLLIGR